MNNPLDCESSKITLSPPSEPDPIDDPRKTGKDIPPKSADDELEYLNPPGEKDTIHILIQYCNYLAKS